MMKLLPQPGEMAASSSVAPLQYSEIEGDQSSDGNAIVAIHH
jgi:hypothetical protein